MEERAQEALADLLEAAVRGIDGAVSFSEAHLPDVVEQLLMWNAVKSGLGFALGVLLILLPLVGFVVFARQRIRKNNLSEMDFVDALMVFAPIMVLGLIFVWRNGDWLQIWIAPKLYLLEYAAKLVR